MIVNLPNLDRRAARLDAEAEGLLARWLRLDPNSVEARGVLDLRALVARQADEIRQVAEQSRQLGDAALTLQEARASADSRVTRRIRDFGLAPRSNRPTLGG